MVNAEETRPATIRILVVDDDACGRHAMVERLQRCGYEVEDAEDGLQAFQRLQQDRFDLVITDIQMPRMDGVALLREICRHDYAPVIVLTTLVDGYLQEVLYRAGASGVLVKGDSATELVRWVHTLCPTPETSEPRHG